MARLALQLGGIALGTAIGGPGLGAAIGGAIGGIAANLLFPPPDINQQGPRLEDQKVTSSAYGQMVPIGYGTFSVAGNLIDASDYYETSHTTTQSSGKGGGGQEVSTTTFTYSIDLAIAICEGEIDGIQEIYANEQLIYDKRTTADAIKKDWVSLKIYTGTETQDPDPTLEAIHTNVPAYRGTAYVVFSRFELQEYGNRPPNFRFVVVSSGTVAITENLIDYDRNTHGHVYNPTNGLLYATLYNTGTTTAAYQRPTLAAIEPRSKTKIWTSDGWDGADGIIQAEYPFVCGYINTDTIPKRKSNTIIGARGITHDSTSYYSYCFWDADSGQVLTNIRYYWGSSTSPSEWSISAYPDDQVFFVRTRKTLGGTYIAYSRIEFNYRGDTWSESSCRISFSNNASGYEVPTSYSDVIQCGLKQGNRSTGVNAIVGFALANSSSGKPALGILEDEVPAITASSPQGLWAANWTSVTEFASSAYDCNYIAYDDITDTFWAHCRKLGTLDQPYWVNIDLDGTLLGEYEWGSLYSVTAIESSATTFLMGCDFENGYIWQELDDGKMYQWDIRNLTTPVQYDGSTITSQYTYVPLTDSLWGDVSDDIREYIYNRITAGTVSLSSIVDDICERADIDSADYDTTALDSTTVRGYLVSRIGSARSAIEPLRQGFLFDSADTGSAIEFRHLGQSLDRTIDEDGIGAHTAGEQMPPMITVHREQEISLPSEMTLNYLDSGANYEIGTQLARRQASQSVQKTSLDLPIVMSYDEAAQQADVLLHLAHIEREHYECRLMPVHSDLIPSDVIAVDDGTNTYRMRIIEKTFQDGYLQIRGVRDESSVLTSTLSGGQISNRDTSITIAGIMQLLILDLPALRYEDNTAGFYAAGFSYAPGWPGGVIMKSSSSGEWSRIGSLSTEASVGFAENAFDATVLNKWDWSDGLEINLIAGDAPSSDTEINVLNGSNIAAWGDEGRYEIIQWVTSTYNSTTGVYTLTQLLRGRYGTEQYTDDHQLRDKFIILDESTIGRFVYGGALGSTIDYLGVTVGLNVYDDSNISQSYTHNGRALKPWAPINIEGTRDVAGEIDVTWNRRDRVISRPFWEPEVSESSESYEIDVLSTGGATTTGSPYTSSTESWTYTTGDQVTDFGSTQSSVDIIVYQISATVDRGFGAEATI